MNQTICQLAACSAALGLVLSMWVGGCASYTERIEQSRQAVTAGEPHAAIKSINEHLGVDDLDEPPDDLEDEKTLYLLERATLLQAIGNYESASRDMIAVDDRLEWIDIGSEAADTVVQFVYTDEAGPYRAPPHERLLLNTMNMINFLARGDMSGARVEARRFNVLQQYFLDSGSRELIPDVLGLGNYLAGCAFEAGGNYREAARYYMLAKIYGTWPEQDDQRLIDLIAMSGYRGSGLGELREGADKYLSDAEEADYIDGSTYRQRHQTGDTLVVVQTGLSPYRQAERLSLADALDYSSRSPYASIHITPDTHEQAMGLYTAGVLTWINTSTLTRSGLPSRRSPRLTVDRQTFRLVDPVEIGEQVQQAWEAVNATAMAAAISRAVVRALAGRATQEATEVAAQQSGTLAPYAGILGWLSRIALQATLAARDTPDTRSWTSLPADMHLVRDQLDAGTHQIAVDVGGRRDEQSVEIQPDRFQLVNFSRLR